VHRYWVGLRSFVRGSAAEILCSPNRYAREEKRWRAHSPWRHHASFGELTGDGYTTLLSTVRLGFLKKNRAMAQGILNRWSSATCTGSAIACDGDPFTSSSQCVGRLFQRITGVKTRCAVALDPSKTCRSLQFTRKLPETSILLLARVSSFWR
jgi:hypothetical protein